ncbi:MAG TPA: ATP-dependent helicase, partial [Candidatus Nanoarchaeia archaeon]|nr:ATP-dependent helicase [Candidatus Nanoarchaeia archaeon]
LISQHPVKISVIEELKGKSGWLILQHLIIDSFDREEYLLFSSIDNNGNALDQETCEKLFHCNAVMQEHVIIPHEIEERLLSDADRHTKATINKSLERNNMHFNEAREQLEKWADDLILAAEKELGDTKEQIKLFRRQARQATSIQEQHEMQEKIRDLELKKRRLRQRIFDVEDKIIEKRDKLINAIEKRMLHRTSSNKVFMIHWNVA